MLCLRLLNSYSFYLINDTKVVKVSLVPNPINMIYFITSHEPAWTDAEISFTDSLDRVINMVRNTDLIGLDTENNGINAINATPLLLQLSDGIDSYVIDSTRLGTKYLKEFNLHNKTIIAHNAQYDYMIVKQQYGVVLKDLIDTMVIEQVLGRGAQRSSSLEATHLRRLNAYMPVAKSTRDDFGSMKYNPVFLRDHIYYSGYDPICLFPIYEKQKPLIKEYKLERRIYDIAFPLISILGDMCLNGFYINKDEWLGILNENKKRKFEIECKLDSKIRQFAKNYSKINGGKWTNLRRKQELTQGSLFGEDTTTENENLHNVSYSSNKQLTYLFKVLKEPLPEKIDKENIKDWENVATKVSFAEEALEQYKIQYPSSKIVPFINDLLDYRKYEKAINSFGEIFIKEYIKKPGSKKYKLGYLNSKTGKVHTIYKQEFTKNGRLSSGDVARGFYNSQQIIKENKYRNCFTLTPKEIEEGWYISTYDLSGAELVILASNSKDKTLIKLLKEGADLHSYLASAIYTKIFRYIIYNMSENRAYDEIANLLIPNRLQHDLEGITKEELSLLHKERIDYVIKHKAFTVDKKKSPDLRNPVKNIVYGINYGAGEEKVAETLNIAPHYAKLAMEAMREELPDAFNYLDNIARFGVKHGYIIFNTRTNSRHWFQSWLDAKEQGRDLSGKDKSAIGRACKNYGISGTQADMIKEAMVEVDKYTIQNNIEIRWLLQVHDEIVIAHKQKDFGELMEKVMVETCNKYLVDIEMGVSGHTGYFWNK
jgi:DNA polymerase I-like protein with 3'-5' exonuclease and polymerase domains